MEQKKRITVQQVIDLLNEGCTRKEIGERLDLTAREVKVLFTDPRLKGKQARKPISFVLVDEDTPEKRTKDIEDEEKNYELKSEEIMDFDDEGVTTTQDVTTTNDTEVVQDVEEKTINEEEEDFFPNI